MSDVDGPDELTARSDLRINLGDRVTMTSTTAVARSSSRELIFLGLASVGCTELLAALAVAGVLGVSIWPLVLVTGAQVVVVISVLTWMSRGDRRPE